MKKSIHEGARDGRINSRRTVIRGLLGSAGAFALIPLLDACQSPQQKPLPAPVLRLPPPLPNYPLVDAHCHIFNACDLPIEGFAREVLLGNAGEWDRTIPDLGSLKYITELLRQPAATACAESSESAPSPPPMDYDHYDAQAQARTDQDRLANVLYWIYTPHSPSGVKRPGSMDLVVRVFESFIRASAKDPNYDPALNALELLHPNSTLQKCRDAAKQIFALRDAGAEPSDVAAKLTWLVKFSRSRKEMLLELDTLFSAATATQAGTKAQYRLYLPAMVDYDFWLDGEPDANTEPGTCAANPPHRGSYKHSVVSEQVMAMAEISRLQPAGHAVLGFVPFDPFRQLMDDWKDTPVKALDVVKDAIANRGCVGVKLYPPMGFGAANNGVLDDSVSWDQVADYFGPQVAFRVNSLRLRFHDITDFGFALDDALDGLYTWCMDNDVPIMTHCSKSQQSFPLAGPRASPAIWQTLLDGRDGTSDYRTLRLNLAHAGGIWCLGLREIDELYYQAVRTGNTSKAAEFAQHYRSLADVCEALDASRRVIQWPELVFLMATDRFPNLYFDIADWAEIYLADWGTSGADGSLAVLKSAFEANPEIANRIMYGTDWSMLGQVPRQAEYCDAIYNGFVNIFGNEAANNIMGRNALRFLGLVGGCTPGTDRRNSPQRTRLRKFYMNSPKADELEQLFDAMCAPAAGNTPV